MYNDIIGFIKELYSNSNENIPLHAPYFGGNEKKYIVDTIDSTFVSSVGEYVTKFENVLTTYTGAQYAIAVTNGTIALQLALQCAGVKPGDEVITQSLSFVATSNAIHHAGASPLYIDVDRDSLGMSPEYLNAFLISNTYILNGKSYNKISRKCIAACVPMHTFGLPCRIDEIVSICNEYHIVVVEDAAESLGSTYKNIHTGTFGVMGSLSFNGNKTITCGGGGAILTNDKDLAFKAKHLSTTAKIPHPWEYVHDDFGYNFRMPNLNAALAYAQMEQLDVFLENKKETANRYRQFFQDKEVTFIETIPDARANNWLTAVLFQGQAEKNLFLKLANEAGISVRPAWHLNHLLPMYASCYHDDQRNAIYISERLVNLPSSFRPYVK